MRALGWVDVFFFFLRCYGMFYGCLWDVWLKKMMMKIVCNTTKKISETTWWKGIRLWDGGNSVFIKESLMRPSRAIASTVSA